MHHTGPAMHSETNPRDGLAMVQPETRAQWRQWLTRNHAAGERVWLITLKKHAEGPRVEYEDAVEEAICFGWVDSKVQRVDEDRTAFLFSHRKPRSNWSQSNKNRVARMTEAGLMAQAGQAEVDAAKADGRWEGTGL
jgi:uncharacterized protein YdeI (YjbR/CyaY-like superfamily)